MTVVSGARSGGGGELPTYTGDKTITGNLTVQGSGVSEWTNSAGVIRMPRGTSTAPAIQFLGTDYGLFRGAPGTNGIAFIVESTNLGGFFQTGGLQVLSSGAIGWSGGSPGDVLGDVTLFRVASRRMGLRGGTNNILDVYGTGTDTTNYERLALITAAGDYTITPQAAGTGVLRGMAIGASGTSLGFYGVAAVARPAAYTQTYSAVTRTHAQDAVATTAATQTSPWGYGTAAQADAIPTAINEVKQLLNQVIDDLQANGLLQ